ncbi:MAG: hypothetical protein P8X47_01095 [Ignavibacteriaceae bacterium]
MKIEERVVKYLDDDLTLEERAAFEKELKSSEELKRVLENFTGVKEKINRQKNLKLSSDYANSILFDFHKKAGYRKKETLRKSLSYAFGLILLILIGISVQKIFFNNLVNNSVDLEKFTQALDENQKLDLLESLNNSNDLSDIISDEEYVDLLEKNLIVNENILENYDIGYKDLIGNLSDNEVNKIYNELISKNILKEVPL